MRMRMEREFVKESPWGICYFLSLSLFLCLKTYTLYGKLLPLVTIWSLNASYYRTTFDFHACDQVHDHSHQHLFLSPFFFLPLPPPLISSSLDEDSSTLFTLRSLPLAFSFSLLPFTFAGLSLSLCLSSFLLFPFPLLASFNPIESRQTLVLMTNQWAGPCLLVAKKSADRQKCQPPPNFSLSFSFLLAYSLTATPAKWILHLA